MSWIALTVVAALLWSVTNIVDKYVLSKWTKNPFVPTIIAGVVEVIFVALVFFVRDIEVLSLNQTLLGLVIGLLYTGSMVYYFLALKVEEVSRVVPLFSLSPLFTGIIAAVFLGEFFSSDKYLGVVLLVLGAILISSRDRFNLRFSKGVWYMVLGVFFAAVGNVVMKYLLGFTDFWTVFVYSKISWFLILAPIVYLNYSDLVSMIREQGRKSITIMTVNESVGTAGGFLFVAASSVGFVTLVSALSQIQMFFLLFFSVILSLWFPKILKEELGGKIVMQKLVAIILMFIGALLIT